MATIYGTNSPNIINGSNGADSLYGYPNFNAADPDNNDNDALYGKLGNDQLYGGTGHDKLYGGGGNDWLYGGAGNDWLYGDNGNDNLYGGNGNDNLYGGNGNDNLYGGNGNDKLYGGNGNDKLYGGNGNDDLYGGNGNDTFYYNYTNGGKDTIHNFTLANNDFIDLVGAPAFPVAALAASAFNPFRVDDWGPAGGGVGLQDILGFPNTKVQDVAGGLEIDFGNNNILTVLGPGLSLVGLGVPGDIA